MSTDLKTMSKRVESELYYVTFEMFVEDVKRMFSNARTYNSPETIYYKCATRHGASTFCLFFFIHLPFISRMYVYLYSCILLQARSTLSKQSAFDSPVWQQSSVGKLHQPCILLYLDYRYCIIIPYDQSAM